MPNSTEKSAKLHKVVSSDIVASQDRESSGQDAYSGTSLLPEFRRSWQMQLKADKQASYEAASGDFGVTGGAPADVWHATYGTHVSRALMQRSSAEFLPEVVIGRDDRVRITNTDTYPYSAICSLEITASTGRQFVGTGWLSSDDTVITAGHCVYMPEQGGWAKHIRIYPGRNGIGQVDDSFEAVRLQSVEGWTKHRKSSMDYGAIQLSRRVAASGHFGYVTLRHKDLVKNLYHVTGYSADKPRGTLWGHVRPLKNIRDDVLYYETDTYGGNSGGPVFFRDDAEDIYVVGIHNYGDISGNSATRITEAVFENIAGWSE